MDPDDLPAPPAQDITEAPPVAPVARPSGFRRTVLTAGMAAALLIAGGVAVVSAASPDPSTSPTPATSTNPSDDGSTDPSSSAAPGQGTRANCPHDGTDDGTSTTTPTPTPTPAS